MNQKVYDNRNSSPKDRKRKGNTRLFIGILRISTKQMKFPFTKSANDISKKRDKNNVRREPKYINKACPEVENAADSDQGQIIESEFLQDTAHIFGGLQK